MRPSHNAHYVLQHIMCVNSASTVLRGAGDDGVDGVMLRWHVVAACGKASVKVYQLHSLIHSKETGLLDRLLTGKKSPENSGF